jgi:hypothetical protein
LCIEGLHFEEKRVKISFKVKYALAVRQKGALTQGARKSMFFGQSKRAP